MMAIPREPVHVCDCCWENIATEQVDGRWLCPMCSRAIKAMSAPATGETTEGE